MIIQFPRNTVVFITAVFFFLINLTSCKEPLIKDGSLTTGDDDLINLGVLDSITVYAKTLKEEPYVSSGVSFGVLGVLDDPFFGKTTTGFYAQYRLSRFSIDKGLNPVLDSIVLSLVYEDKYGKNTMPVSIAVYELMESMNAAITYKTNETFVVNGAPIGQANMMIPNLKDSVKVLGQNQAPQLRIRLSNAIGNRILNADSLTLSSNENFLNFFKGLYVTASGNGNGVTYINLLSSKVILYYRNNDNDSLKLELGIGNSSARMNYFKHNGFSFAQQAVYSTAVTDSILYAQSGAGSTIKITFPFLNNLPKDIVINKAELIIPKWENDLQGSDTVYTPPSLLSIFVITPSGGFEKLDNNIIERSGIAPSRTIEENGKKFTTYTFTPTRRMQSMIRDAGQNNGFLITTTGAARADRLILANNPANPNQRIKLKLTYSKVN